MANRLEKEALIILKIFGSQYISQQLKVNGK